jgi:hypothetical protein
MQQGIPTMNLSRITYLYLTFLLATFLLVACGREESMPVATQAPAADTATANRADAPQVAAPVTLPSDPKAAILQAMRAQLTAGPYRTTTTMIMDGSEQTSVGLMIPPDRLQVTMNLGDITTEMIYIGAKVWSKQGDEAWQESDRLGTPGAGLVGEEMITDSEKTITAAALVGPEAVDGVEALRYTYTNDLNQSGLMAMDSVQQVTLWLNAASGLIIRQEIEDTTAGTPSKTVQVIEYDATITIAPPVK